MEKKNIHSENNSHKRYEATALPTYRMSDTCNISLYFIRFGKVRNLLGASVLHRQSDRG